MRAGRYEKLIFINCLVVFLCFRSEARELSKKDYKSLPKILKQNGINPESVTTDKSEVFWQANCNTGAGNESDSKGVVLFDAKVAKPFELKGIMLTKGATISFCEGEIRSIRGNFDSQGRPLDLEKDGFFCTDIIELNKKGQLCQCLLAKDIIVDGFKVPKGTDMVLKNGKPYSFIFSPRDLSVKDYWGDIFLIENGKPIVSAKQTHSCEFEE